MEDDGKKTMTTCQYFFDTNLSLGPQEGVMCSDIDFKRYALKYNVLSGSHPKCCEDIKTKTITYSNY